MELWQIGVTINVIGSLSVNLATNLLKKSHNLKESKEADEKDEAKNIIDNKQHHHNCFVLTHCVATSSECYWRVGVVLFLLGSVINLVSLGMAAQSLLAILGGIQFVSNLAFGRLVLNEKVNKSLIQ